MQYRQKKLNILLFILAVSILPIRSQSGHTKLFIIEWLRDNLDNNKLPEFIKWLEPQDESSLLSFRIAEPKLLAQEWGKYTGHSAMNYEKMARGMRNSYKKGTLAKLEGKRLCYYFMTDSNAKKITNNPRQSLSSDSQTAAPQQPQCEQRQVEVETSDIHCPDQQSTRAYNDLHSVDEGWFLDLLGDLASESYPDKSP